MLCFLITFIALITTIKQWIPLFSLQVAIHTLDGCCSFTYPFHDCSNTMTCALYDSFPNLDPMLDVNSIGSIWYLVAGHKTQNATQNTGHKTHTSKTGPMTHSTSYPSSNQGSYCSMPGCHLIWHHNVTAGCSMTNKSSYSYC